MTEQSKAIVIGASTVGKTTIIRHLRDKYNLSVYEFDEELNRRNGGTYPFDVEYRRNVLVPSVQNDILNRDSVLFFTNTRCFTQEDIKHARSRGFRIVQLILDRDEMVRRNKQRMDKEGYSDHASYFDEMILYQQKLLERDMVDKVVDASRSVKVIADELLSYLDLQ
jgi:hypothetical protein